jgi:transposase
MTLDLTEGSELRVVKVLSNGKRRFDPVSRERLIDAAAKPGVSVARLALAHGVNANQLRNWVKLRRDRRSKVALADVGRRETSAFVPVVEALPTARLPDTSVPPSSMGMRLKASLPNGVRLELEDADAHSLSVMIEVLGRCYVPAG